MQSRLQGSKAKTFVALVDADGCFYNTIFDALFRYLIANYGFFLTMPSAHLSDNLVDRILQDVCSAADNFHKEYEKTGSIHLPSYINQFILANNPSQEGDVEERISQIKLEYIRYLLALRAKGEDIYQTIILIANKHWVDFVESRVKLEEYQQFLLMSGSSRQSKKIEEINMLCYGTRPFVMELLDLIKLFRQSINHRNPHPVACYFDRFMLADIYADKYPGHSFDRIFQDAASLNGAALTHHGYVFDETKFTLLYAMMHYVASKHKDQDITLAFFDDRKDIHDVNGRIFSQHPDLLPANVTLECWHYEGQALGIPMFVVKGEGMIDHHFSNNIKRMIEWCGVPSDKYEGNVDTGRCILDEANLSILSSFKLLRDTILIARRQASTLFTRSHPTDLAVARDQPAHPAPDDSLTPTRPGQ